MTLNVDRMRRYNQGGRVWRQVTAPYRVQDWFGGGRVNATAVSETALCDYVVPEGAAPRYIPGVSP